MYICVCRLHVSFNKMLVKMTFKKVLHHVTPLTCFAALQINLIPAPKKVVGSSMAGVHVFIIFLNNSFTTNLAVCLNQLLYIIY